jgi:hypothetical protein
MKTWEMIKELTENPEKIFKNQNEEEIRVLPDDELYFDDGYKNIHLHDEWKEVKKPVDFMAAVKSGKRFKLINKDDAEGVLTRYMDLNTFMDTLSSMWSKELSKAILTEGKFYIED